MQFLVDPREPDIDENSEARAEQGIWSYSGNPNTEIRIKNGKPEYRTYDYKTKRYTYGLPYSQPMQNVQNGPEAGLKKKMEYWENKDFKTEFQILSAQSLNLAVQAHPNSTAESLIIYAKGFFAMLIMLREDSELKKEFEAYYARKN